MIQRIQSLWLCLAFLAAIGLFYFDLFYSKSAEKITSVRLTIVDDYLSLVLAAIIFCLPIIALFSFRNRKRQKTLIGVNILSSLLLIAVTLARVASLQENMPGSEAQYGFAALLPLFVVLFSILAYKGIRKDEKLLRSVDRFR